MPLIVIIVIAAVLLAVVTFLVVRRTRTGRPPAPPSPPRAPQLQETAATGLGKKLARSRAALGGKLAALFTRALDESLWDDLEEALIAADVGVAAATSVVASVRAAEPDDAVEARRLVREALCGLLGGRDRELRLTGHPAVIVVVGVNGTGKTTSIAKIAAQLRARGCSPLLGAADTYRAAADQQLRTWAERVGVDIVSGQEGADPASVAFDSYGAAKARGRDVLIVDTAGRLHSKRNLMDELDKVVRVLRREAGEDLSEVLLVIDGTTGQNAIAQARTFTEAVGVTGIVITKLDGTARGGAAVAVERELDVPVKFIGVGEGVEDLIPFNPEDFVDALLEE